MGDTNVAGNANPYLAIGVRPFINCCGTRTLHGGSLLSSQARLAIAEAARNFVDLDELMEGAGRRIAELTGAEWGLVTCGSAAALALGTAACVAGNDPVKMLRLPFTEGMANRVIMMRGQRFAYDNAIRMVGTHIVEVDSRAELEAALDDRVAMIAILGKEEETGAVRLEEIAALAKPRGIPIMVDAASEHPTLPIPWLVRGADLVIYSGGKFMRGPQTSGLLLGAKNLVQAAARNSAPHHAFGRPMKVSKEDVIGVLAALEYWLTERDAAAESHRWQDEIDIIAQHVSRLPDISCEITPPTDITPVPLLMISWNQERYAIDGVSLRQAMLDGTPRIIFDDRWAAGNHVGVDPFNFQPGEAAAVGRALVAALTAAGRKTPTKPAAANIDITGAWEVQVKFLHGARTHRMHLNQTGGVLTGTHSSDGFNGAVTGRVEADRVHLQFAAFFEGVTIVYTFEGIATDSGLAGTVLFGCSNGENAGVANRSQYGEGSWTATRSA